LSGTAAAIYARVSTDDQDEDRQIQDCREELDDHPYEISDVSVYADVQTGTTTDRESFNQLVQDVEAGDLDLVISTEVSRLSRSGAQDVMEFITLCLNNDVSVEFTQSPVSLRTEADTMTQAIQRLIVSLMSELASIEHKQKMSRIESGIQAAQAAGKWTGRAPRGFEVGENGRLHVAGEEFLRIRAALERCENGEAVASVADDVGMPESSLRYILNDDERRAMYFDGEADDQRKDAALEEIRPLPEVDVNVDEDEVLEDRVDELEAMVQDLADGQ